MSKTLVIREIGRQSYEKILSQMKHFTNVRSESTADEIWILEHHPVFTQGQAGNSDYILASGDIPVVQSDRGGHVTFHGHGQITAYTLIDLKHPDVKFDDTYLSYFYGLGLQFALGKYAQLYGRYGIDNALNLTENSDGKTMERYEIRKKRISIGLIVDLTAVRKRRDKQNRELASLRQALTELTAADNSDQDVRISALEQTVQQQSQQIEALLADGKAPLATKTHAEGFDYLFEFTPIAFPLDSAVLDHDKFAVPLQKAAAFLRKNPHFNLMVVGYADHTGAAGYNKELSVQRALRVRDYLHVKHGLPLTSIKWIGAGETVRFSDDNTQKNRRTELLIIKPNK